MNWLGRHRLVTLRWLRRQERFFSLVVERGTIVYISPGLRVIMGLQREAVVGKPRRYLLSDVEWDFVQYALLDPEGPGESVRLNLTCSPQRVIGFRGFAGHLGEDNKQSALLWGFPCPARTEEELQWADRLGECQVTESDELMATLSHEIRTPVSNLLGVIDLAKNATTANERTQLLSMMSNIGQQLQLLLTDVLEETKYNAKRPAPKRIPFQLRPLLEDQVARFALLYPHLTVSLKYDEILPKLVRGDATRLAQILTNFLSNAVKYTSKGSVTLTAHDVGNKQDVQFVIQDTGKGLTPELQARLFMPYSRGRHGSPTISTGLGLYIARRMIIDQGGTLKVDSQLGEGTAMTFTLPLISEDLRGMEPPEPQQSSIEIHTPPPAQPVEVQSPIPQPATSPKGKKKILLVDDNPINILVAQKFIEHWGYQPCTASSGAQALEMLAQESFFLIFMDIRMPDMDGYETTQCIRSLATGKAKTPIIALTASTEIGVRTKIIEAGMDGYIFKPFDAHVLQDIVEKYVGRPEW